MGFWIISKERAGQTMGYEMKVTQSAVNIMHSSYPAQAFHIAYDHVASLKVSSAVSVNHGNRKGGLPLVQWKDVACGWQGIKAARWIEVSLL